MTKKHLIQLADLIRMSNATEPNAPFGPDAIKILADFCAMQNPNFLRSRWIAYIAGKCGPNGGAVK